MTDDGILLLEVLARGQRRHEQTSAASNSRINDPRKIWKLSEMDLKSYCSRWYDYSRAEETPCSPATDTAWAPWFIAHTDDKKRGRLNIISHLLSQIPYKPLAPGNITLPRRQLLPAATPNPTLPLQHIPAPF